MFELYDLQDATQPQEMLLYCWRIADGRGGATGYTRPPRFSEVLPPSSEAVSILSVLVWPSPKSHAFSLHRFQLTHRQEFEQMNTNSSLKVDHFSKNDYEKNWKKINKIKIGGAFSMVTSVW